MKEVEQIEHKGFVTQINEGIMSVTILSSAACSSCSVNSSCSTSESEEKIIEVKIPEQTTYKVGDVVDVFYKQSLGFRALFLGYLLPFLLLMFTLITTMSVTKSEGAAGIFSLLVLIPYYLTLYLTKNKLKETFAFSVKMHSLQYA